jgi:hypothetical protein
MSHLEQHLRNIERLDLPTLQKAQADLITRSRPKKAGPEEWWTTTRLRALSQQIRTLTTSQP